MPTRDKVFQALNEMQSAGEKITVRSLTERVKGSFRENSRYLSDWEAERMSGGQDKSPMPDDVTSAAESFAATVWSVAMRVASSEVQVMEVALQSASKQMQAERDDLLQALDETNAEKAKHAEDLAMHKEALKGLQTNLDFTRGAADALERTHKERVLEVATLSEKLEISRRSQAIAEAELALMKQFKASV